MPNRILSIGEKFPAFRKKAVVSIEKGKEFTEITQEYGSAEGKWTVLFWWPKDFTFVCPTEIAYRATFIIDPQGIVRWVSVYDLNVGRSVQEVLRVLDALQTDELCPCNW